VKPGKSAEFILAWREFAEWTAKSQNGTIEGTLLQDTENPDRLISFGAWPDMKSMDEWRQTPRFKEAIAKFRELCTDLQRPQTARVVASSNGYGKSNKRR